MLAHGAGATRSHPLRKVIRLLHTALIATHVLAGTAGLVLGPLAMHQDTRRFTAGRRGTGRASSVYRGLVLLVCASAVGLVVENRPELWWLVPVSALTYGLAVLARESAKRRFRGWVHGYAHGQGGSYIALVTALIVVALTVDGPVTGAAQLVPWLAPTLLGTVLIERWRRHLHSSLPVGMQDSAPPGDIAPGARHATVPAP